MMSTNIASMYSCSVSNQARNSFGIWYLEYHVIVITVQDIVADSLVSLASAFVGDDLLAEPLLSSVLTTYAAFGFSR